MNKNIVTEEDIHLSQMIMKEVYPLTTEILDWLGVARSKGFITHSEFNKHWASLMDMVVIFQAEGESDVKTD